jgi:hypothetical protein
MQIWINNTEKKQNAVLAIRWHTALFHVQLGEFESALTLYDDRVGPMTLKGEQTYWFNGTLSQGFVQPVQPSALALIEN